MSTKVYKDGEWIPEKDWQSVKLKDYKDAEDLWGVLIRNGYEVNTIARREEGTTKLIDYIISYKSKE